METKTKEPKSPAPGRTSKVLSIDTLVPDPANRRIDETEEEFSALVDSIRVFGVLQAIHVCEQGDAYQIIDGERRWRAAKRAGLAEVTCEVWPASTRPQDLVLAGVIINEHRQAHTCIHVARRLREIKNEGGLTSEQLSERTGFPIDRIKTYLCLFGGSDFLLEFFSKHDVPLKVAAELIRFEKATNESRARRIAQQYLDKPMSRHALAQLRKNATSGDAKANEESEPKVRKTDLRRVIARAWQNDPRAAQAELELALREIGFHLVAQGGSEK